MSQTQIPVIQTRQRMVVNNDPQRRCYNGCHASTEVVVGSWEDFETCLNEEHAKKRIVFWTELNDYAVDCRGKGAKRDYRVVLKDKEEFMS